MARPGLTSGRGGTLVLDSEGLAKAAGNDRRVQAELTTALRRQARVLVSAVTLAEVLRGGRRDVAVHRVLNRVVVLPVSKDLGRAAGELLGSSAMPGSATVDAIVAATALAQPGPVKLLTSDPDDLRKLTELKDDVVVVRV